MPLSEAQLVPALRAQIGVLELALLAVISWQVLAVNASVAFGALESLAGSTAGADSGRGGLAVDGRVRTLVASVFLHRGTT
jgi:hypothetical protein